MSNPWEVLAESGLESFTAAPNLIELNPLGSSFVSNLKTNSWFSLYNFSAR